MAQIRFTDSDPDLLRASVQVLKGIQKQIRAAIENEERMPEGAYNALSNLAQVSMTLDNWATLLDTGRWRLLLERQSQ